MELLGRIIPEPTKGEAEKFAAALPQLRVRVVLITLTILWVSRPR
jgi:hypothetical protein